MPPVLPDLSNTEIAFAYKKNLDLVRTYHIFRLINLSWLVKIGTNITSRLLDAGVRKPIALAMRPTVYSVFCGGTSLEDAAEKIDEMYKSGVQSVLDYGVEAKEKEEDFERTAAEVRHAIDFASGNAAVRIVSSKFTGLLPFGLLEKLHAGYSLSPSEQQLYERSVARIEGICDYASRNNVCLFVDAEESWIQRPLDQLVTRMMERYNTEKPVIYNTIQLYLQDRLPYFKKALKKAKASGYIYAAKLVRGAYMEKEAQRATQKGYPNPIQPDKTSTDHDYDEAVAFALENIDHAAICVATHNEKSCLKTCRIMQERGIEPNHPHVYFSQLLGMSDHISFNLARSGYSVGKYMPYGPVSDVIPYLVRRAQENTSVSGQMGRELTLLREEIRRRKLPVW